MGATSRQDGADAGVRSDALRDTFQSRFEELRRHAHRLFGKRGSGATLQATALIGEAFLRMAGLRQGGPVAGPGDAPRSEAHCMALAASAMRSALVDAARAKRTAKRGGKLTRVPLDGLAASDEGSPSIDVLALDEALREFERMDPEGHRLIELRFFAGLTIEEAARALGIGRATAAREWLAARTWLAMRLL